MAAKINRTGKTYGDLTVLETIPGSNSKADTYLVKCNCCGNTMIIGIDALLKGLKCKDCRGKDRKRTYQDLVGEEHNGIKVISLAEDAIGSTGHRNIRYNCIFLPKDDRGTIMDSHEIRVDLCRAVIHMEKKGVRVLKVRNIEDTNKASIDIWHMPEYQEAAESPVSDVVNACIESCFDSGAMFNLPCKANRKTHEVFAVECCASPDDDDSFSYAEVKINGKDYPINFIDDILLENNVDDALDEFYRIQQTGEYWQPDGNKTLDDAIHECRWAILKDAIQKRGHEAVADFVGTDISSDTYDRVMDETEAQMPDEEFERFWEKYI